MPREIKINGDPSAPPVPDSGQNTLAVDQTIDHRLTDPPPAYRGTPLCHRAVNGDDTTNGWAFTCISDLGWKLILAVALCIGVASGIAVMIFLDFMARELVLATPDWVFWLVIALLFIALFTAVTLIVLHCSEQKAASEASVDGHPDVTTTRPTRTENTTHSA